MARVYFYRGEPNAFWFIEYKKDMLSVEDIIRGYQAMINSGIIQMMPEPYFRVAEVLLSNGYCKKVSVE